MKIETMTGLIDAGLRFGVASLFLGEPVEDGAPRRPEWKFVDSKTFHNLDGAIAAVANRNLSAHANSWLSIVPLIVPAQLASQNLSLAQCVESDALIKTAIVEKMEAEAECKDDLCNVIDICEVYASNGKPLCQQEERCEDGNNRS